MAYQITRNCWTTPKCGYSIAKWYFIYQKPVNYKFIIVRNPYYRLVSFYINKIVFNNISPWNLSKHDWKIEEYLETDFLPNANTGMSFREIVNLLKKQNLNEVNEHIIPQWLGVEDITFDKIVHLENFKEEIQEPCEILGFDYEYIINRKPNQFPKNEDIRENVMDKPAKWFRENGVPKKYNLFYDDELQETVYALYEKDFKLWGYDKCML